MRLEYTFDIGDVATPRLSVEAVEGIGKLFTLATLVLNVMEVKEMIELVFHGLNPDDPSRKIEAFKKIIESASTGVALSWEEGNGGGVPGSSSYFQWMLLRKAG